MPPRPRTPRSRVSTIRRPRVAGTAPAAQRTTVADRSVPDDATTHTRPIPLGPAALAESSAPSPSAPSPSDWQPNEPAAEEPTAERSVRERSASDKSAAEEPAADGSALPPRRRLRLRKTAAVRDGAATGSGAKAAADLASDSGSRRSLRVPLLAVALVVLTALAVFFGVADARLRGTPAAANSALVDVGTTAEASGQLTDALQTVYSYDFARLDENERAARAVITPEFADQFNRLFAQVRDLAPQQQAVVSATVTLAAVKEITGDRAVLVAFMDQQATRAAAADGKPTQLAAAGRLTVTGQKVDGRWKIAAVESK
jgi:Mce-associated membrane protein